MTTKTSRRAAKTKTRTKGSHPLPRPILNTMLVDLHERIEHTLANAEAIGAANAPNSKHTVAEHQLRTVFGLLMENQLSSLRDIEGFAQIICERQVQS